MAQAKEKVWISMSSRNMLFKVPRIVDGKPEFTLSENNKKVYLFNYYKFQELPEPKKGKFEHGPGHNKKGMFRLFETEDGVTNVLEGNTFAQVEKFVNDMPKNKDYSIYNVVTQQMYKRSLNPKAYDLEVENTKIKEENVKLQNAIAEMRARAEKK